MAEDFQDRAISSGDPDPGDSRSSYVFRAFAKKKMHRFKAALNSRAVLWRKQGEFA